MIKSVFTEKYQQIQRKIINSVVIEAGDNYLPANALWDTGATGTCISKQLANKLNLIPIGVAQIHTPSGIGTVNRFIINLILNGEFTINNLVVMDSEIGNQGLDILIGMDIISRGDFSISNFDGKTHFAFRLPSQEHIEYRR